MIAQMSLLDMVEVPAKPWPGPGTAPYAPDSDTSREAAKAIEPYLQAQEAKVLSYLDEPRTIDEIEVRSGLSHQSAGARMRALVLKGIVEATEARRKTRSGRNAVVWQRVKWQEPVGQSGAEPNCQS